MEQKNLIIREEDSNDSRKKKVSLTSDAIILSKEFVKERNEFERKINEVLGDKLESFSDSLLILDNYFNGGEK
jgi:DNA-binding MarR family transcriptional regulator